MELVILIVALALTQFLYLGFLTGMARRKYKVQAPAVSGHPVFERQFRVQQNTLEQLVVFVPAIFSYAWMADRVQWYGSEIAAMLGVVWLIGRALYARAYVQEPLSRRIGFVLTVVPSVILIVGTIMAIMVAITQG